jgi:uncharacterized phiE125 gp8 family phage protein
MKLKRTSAPLIEPITLADAKDHLKVTSTGEDSVIGFELSAACKYLENEMGVQMITCGWEGYLNCFPNTTYIEFPLSPITGVSKVEYFATNGIAYTEFAAANYIFDDVHKPPRLYLAPGCSWPGTEPRVNAVKVTFNAGHNLASDIPPNWIQALKLAITFFHEHRGDEGIVTIPKPIKDLIFIDSLMTV